MARKINDWLGKKVIYRGVIEKWNELNDHAGFVLLIRVYLRPYKLDTNDTRVEDHFWYKLSGKSYSSIKKFGRLFEVTGLAEIINYERLDGTNDLGISPLGANFLFNYTLALDHINTAIRSRHHLDKEYRGGCYYLIIQICQRILTDLKKERLVFEMKYSYDQIKKHFEELESSTRKQAQQIDPEFDDDNPPIRWITQIKGLMLFVLDILKTSITTYS